MRNECAKCENDNLMRVAELEIENERLRDWRYRLEQALEQSHEMIKALREENESLQTENKELTHYLACMTEQRNKANTCLQEIKAIAENNQFYFVFGTVISYKTLEEIQKSFTKILALIKSEVAE